MQHDPSVCGDLIQISSQRQSALPFELEYKRLVLVYKEQQSHVHRLHEDQSGPIL